MAATSAQHKVSKRGRDTERGQQKGRWGGHTYKLSMTADPKAHVLQFVAERKAGELFVKGGRVERRFERVAHERDVEPVVGRNGDGGQHQRDEADEGGTDSENGGHGGGREQGANGLE
ncbi:hypothetical protein FGB62_128g015 [Gracilaria domingensis]|nr:hypothetical protein FGB62_128g015 [Gracilaria domingensis]